MRDPPTLPIVESQSPLVFNESKFSEDPKVTPDKKPFIVGLAFAVRSLEYFTNSSGDSFLTSSKLFSSKSVVLGM